MIVPLNPAVQSVSESSVSKPAGSEPFIPTPLIPKAFSELPSLSRPEGLDLTLNIDKLTVKSDSDVLSLDALNLEASPLDGSTESAPLAVKAEVQIFLSTFLTIFLAEIGDKTQLTILLMSAESQSPWLIFLGAGLALIATSLCGVLLGKWLSTRISPKALDTSAGLLLIFISALLTWDFFQA